MMYFVLCQGLNASNLLHCPHQKRWKPEEHQAAMAFGLKHEYSHIAHVEDDVVGTGLVQRLESLGATT